MTKVSLDRTYKTPDSCVHVPLYKMTQSHVDSHFKDGFAKGQLVETHTLANGKQASLVTVSSREGDAEPSPCLLCSCTLHAQVMDTDMNVSCMWMDRCEAKEALREIHAKKVSSEYRGEAWKDKDAKEKILDIWRRVNLGEYLGQWHGNMIYVQEVARLLELPEAAIWRACRELFKEEKLDLNGAILWEYKSRFRFPKELQSLMAYIIEEPLGWPNGDAGDGFIHTLEAAIDKHTRYKHGKTAFGEENYPNLAAHHLVSFGLRFLEGGLAGIMADKQEREGLDLTVLVSRLRTLQAEAKKAAAQAKKERNK